MRYQLMTPGVEDPDHYDIFSWDPPTTKDISTVSMGMTLYDLLRPDGFITKYLGNYDYADLVYELNVLDFFPGVGVFLQEVMDYEGSQSEATRTPLANRLATPILIPDVKELRAYITKNMK